MKTIGRTLLFSAVLLATSLVVAEAPATVEDLVIAIADLRDLDAGSGDAAVRALRDTGVEVSERDLGAVLTEARMTRVLSAAGLRVTTTRPDAVISAEQLDSILIGLAPEIGADDPSTTPTTDEAGPYPRPNDEAADPATKGKKNGTGKGKGKKKGHGVSPSSPV
jgi:hypothetical protein